MARIKAIRMKIPMKISPKRSDPCWLEFIWSSPLLNFIHQLPSQISYQIAPIFKSNYFGKLLISRLFPGTSGWSLSIWIRNLGGKKLTFGPAEIPLFFSLTQLPGNRSFHLRPSPFKNRDNSDWGTLHPLPALMALILPRRIYLMSVDWEIFK